MIKAEEFTGELLKELRKKYKLTQKEVAEGIGTTNERISEWENHKRPFGGITRKALEYYFERVMKSL